ncbi:MAG: hypothetical protein RL033_3517 [Pseudomonadota bacterium]
MARHETTFDQAKALAKRLAKIDQRAEAAHIKLEAAHMELQARFEAEKEAVRAGASDAVLRVIEDARDQVGGGSGK